MALQRAFSGFPSGCPGLALLLLRVTAGCAGGVHAWGLLLMPHFGPLRLLAASLMTASSAALVLGLMTPIAGLLLCLGEILLGLYLSGPLFMQPGGLLAAHAEIIVVSAALVCLGPGALSLDARLYGRREIKVNGNGA